MSGAPPEPKTQNLSTVHHRVSVRDRAQAKGHRGAILWFTGLSGSGKSTLAVALEGRLFARGYQVCLLDGDNIRQGLSGDLGFSPEDRAENVRRIGEVARLLADAGMVVITAIISPYRRDRDRIRAAHVEIFNEVFIDAPLEVCESRDAKGLYRKARAGLIKEFTGVSAPYEPPLLPELHIATATSGVDACLAQILDYVEARLSAAQERELQRA